MHSLKMPGCKTIIYDDIAQEGKLMTIIFKKMYILPYFVPFS